MNFDDDRATRPRSTEPKRGDTDDPGPRRPDIGRPDAPNELLRRMRKVDPDQAKRYRQRSGE